METSPTFLKWRASAFACISFASLLWIILFSIIVFERWGLVDRAEKGFLAVLLFTNTINLITLPILILRQFRPWLDAARMLFLLTLNIGIAAFFTYWNPRFHCPDQTADSQGVCQLINMYILLANWVNPGLLIAYSCCLVFIVWWRSRQPPSVATEEDSYYEESSIGTAHLSMHIIPTVPAMTSRQPSTLIPTTPTSLGTLPPRAPLHEWHGLDRGVFLRRDDRKKSVGEETAISRMTAPVEALRRPSTLGTLPPKTSSRKLYSSGQDIYINRSDRVKSFGGDLSTISRPPMSARLSKQQLSPPVLLY